MQVDAINGGNLKNVAVWRGGDQSFATDILRRQADHVGSVVREARADPRGGRSRYASRTERVRRRAHTGQYPAVRQHSGRRSRLRPGPRDACCDHAIQTSGPARYIEFDRAGSVAVIPNEGGWVT